MPRIATAIACLFLSVGPLNAQEARSEANADSLPPDEWLALDKAAHVFGGFWSAGTGYGLAARYDADREGQRAGAIAAGAVAGLAKEAFDRWVQEERFSWKDLAADAVGIALFLALTAGAEP